MPDLSKIEASQKQTQADLKAVGDQIKAYAERTEKEIKHSGDMQTETRAKVDELLSKQGELQARMQDAEQKLVNAGKRHEPEIQQTAGHLVAAKMSEEGVTSSFRGSRRVEVPRAAITSAPGSGGALVAPDRVGVILAPQRRLTIRDLVAPGTTGANAVEYVRETGFTNNATIVGEGLAKPYSDLTFGLENANVRTIAHLFKGSRQILDDA
uniref:phage major capsid protein n=1 Tax=Pseudomonas sp. TWR3-1-1 TaxID=2804633 RepID=UPI003CEE626B